MNSIAPPSETVKRLHETLDTWNMVHERCQVIDARWREFETALKAAKQHAAFEASNNPHYKNAEQRAAAVQQQLNDQFRDLLEEEATAAEQRRDAFSDLERLTETLKTLRVICRQETAEREALTAYQQAEAFRTLPF
jgi:hypothetical protein